LCCNNGNGFYKLSAGNTTIRTGTSFTGEQTSQFYSQSGVGIKQHPDAASISVFPNPVESYATISFENAVNETVTVRLFNMQGSKVQEIPAKAYPSGSHEISIDCTAMPSGIYSIQMTIGNKVFSEKISVR
jgi:hypothetical protein